jgi:GH15 family glucan-1,4-alpha-glucosidase
VEQFRLPGPVERWRAHRDEIHEEICRQGYDSQVGAFVQSYGSTALDASLLMIPLVGFLPATDPRMNSTVRAIQGGLLRDGFVERYRTDPEVDGLPRGEGTFLLCTFWMADNLELQGRQEEARALFNRLLSIRSELGLLSESYDTSSGRLVGNFPQAFSHVGLINSARNLSKHDGPAQDRARS